MKPSSRSLTWQLCVCVGDFGLSFLYGVKWPASSSLWPFMYFLCSCNHLGITAGPNQAWRIPSQYMTGTEDKGCEVPHKAGHLVNLVCSHLNVIYLHETSQNCSEKVRKASSTVPTTIILMRSRGLSLKFWWKDKEGSVSRQPNELMISLCY